MLLINVYLLVSDQGYIDIISIKITDIFRKRFVSLNSNNLALIGLEPKMDRTKFEKKLLQGCVTISSTLFKDGFGFFHLKGLDKTKHNVYASSSNPVLILEM